MSDLIIQIEDKRLVVGIPSPVKVGATIGLAGGDLAGTYPDPEVAAVHETGGPTQLVFGAVADGQALVRSGNTIVGDSAAAKDTVGLAFGRNSPIVTPGTYLRGSGNVSTSPGATPYIAYTSLSIIAATANLSLLPAGAWGIEVLVNGAGVLTLNDPGTSKEIIQTGLSLPVVAGDEISARVLTTGASVNKPSVLLILKM